MCQNKNCYNNLYSAPYQGKGQCLSSGRCLCWWGWTGPNACYVEKGTFTNRLIVSDKRTSLLWSRLNVLLAKSQRVSGAGYVQNCTNHSPFVKCRTQMASLAITDFMSHNSECTNSSAGFLARTFVTGSLIHIHQKEKIALEINRFVQAVFLLLSILRYNIYSV